MKLAIFGASGRVGIRLVQQALAAGNEVNDRLTLVQGDAMNQTDVEKVAQKVNAVISVLGHRKDSPKDMQTVAIQNIITAM